MFGQKCVIQGFGFECAKLYSVLKEVSIQHFDDINLFHDIKMPMDAQQSGQSRICCHFKQMERSGYKHNNRSEKRQPALSFFSSSNFSTFLCSFIWTGRIEQSQTELKSPCYLFILCFVYRKKCKYLNAKFYFHMLEGRFYFQQLDEDVTALALTAGSDTVTFGTNERNVMTGSRITMRV